MFTQRLQSQLKISIKGKEYKVQGGNIKHCALHLEREGFTGSLGFYLSNEVSDDTLIDDWIKNELVEFELEVAQHSFSKEKPGEPLVLKGVIGQRSVEEKQFLDVKKSKVLFRYYRCQLFDPAQYLWQQHHPTQLHVKQTLKKVIQAQLVKPIKLDMDWPHLEQEQPMVCLGLGAIHVSFYTFLRWYLAQHGAYLLYDYVAHQYKISADKPEVKPKQEVKLWPEQVELAQMQVAEPDLRSTHLLNGHVTLASNDVILEGEALPGVQQDSYLIASIKQDAETAKKQEKPFTAIREPELYTEMKQWHFNAIHPGCTLQLKHPLWHDKMLAVKAPFLVYRSQWVVNAINAEPMHDLHMEHSDYDCEVSHCGESLKDKHWPRTQPCLRPFLVHGEILCEVGDEPDKTYQYKKDDKTKQHFYRVKIPVFSLEGDKEILIRFQPDFLPPHFYFPLYKGTQVEVEMHLFEARITRVLDWGARVFLEQDNQGNHLVFGKNDKDETKLKHDYQDEKPVLSLERLKEKDTQLMQMEEGKITLRTQENE